MSVARKMAVIVAGDVVGYSRLVAADEEGTLARLKALQREFVRPKIAEHRGRVFKLTGDGILIEFASAVDALRCAIELQLGMRQRSRDLMEDRRLVFRVGIHLGDVMIEGHDLLGDGVNIAARLEGLCEPGGIAISRGIYEQAKDKLPVEFDDRGEQALKNIPDPVRLYAVRFGNYLPEIVTHTGLSMLLASRPVSAGAAAAAVVLLFLLVGWSFWPQPAPAPVQQAAAPPTFVVPAVPQLPAAIAGVQPAGERAALIVLPFTNISSDPQQDYFCDGFTEDLTTAFARFPEFRVIARNSAFVFKGKTVDAAEVGRKLNVRYVLEGSVQKSADRLRVNAQLIEAATGSHVWANKYDESPTDLFVLQDKLSTNIVGIVASHLRRAENQRASRISSETLDAYELSIRARQLITSGSTNDAVEARRVAEQAIERDPSFALGHLQLSLSLITFFSNRLNDEFGSPIIAQRAADEAGKAVALGPGDPVALAVRGRTLTMVHQFDAAVAAARQALAIGENDGAVLASAAVALQRSGEVEESIRAVQRAFVLDPYLSDLNPTTFGGVLGGSLFMLHRYREAYPVLTDCINRQPNLTVCRVYLVAAFAQAGDIENARGEATALLRVSPQFTIGAERSRRLQAFRDVAEIENVLDGLRKAGVPE